MIDRKEKFHIWFNSERFSYEHNSCDLAYSLYEHFDEWWDADKFNWKEALCLFAHCDHKIEIWFDPDKIDWVRLGGGLPQAAPHLFDLWWPYFKEQSWNFDDNGIDLAKYCSDKFDIWYDQSKFDGSMKFDDGTNWMNCMNSLASNCANKFDIWFNPNTFDWDSEDYLDDCAKQFSDWFWTTT